MAQRATIRTEGDRIILQMEYNARAIKVLKDSIPTELRTYNSGRNVWSIAISQSDIVTDIVRQFYVDINEGPIRTFTE